VIHRAFKMSVALVIASSSSSRMACVKVIKSNALSSSDLSVQSAVPWYLSLRCSKVAAFSCKWRQSSEGTSQDMPDIPVQAGKPDQLEDAMLLAKYFSLLDVLLVILAPVNKIARILACRSLLSNEGNYRTLLCFGSMPKG
jgi:hypothetical protein